MANEERKVTQEDIKNVTSTLDESLRELGDDQNADLSQSLLVLLEAPDEQFDILAPGVLESFKQSVNNPNDKLMLVQALNSLGYTSDDIINDINEVLTGFDKLELPVAKKDFLKQLVATIVNAVSETEGIAKRYISIPLELCHENAKIPQYAHISDSGVDVYALDDITVKPGETVLVPTGIKVALPPGYELQVRPKSGRALKTKLRVANTPGTIDSGYRDEIKVIIENVDPPIKDIQYTPSINVETGKVDHLIVTSIEYGSDFFIGRGEKFCQLVLSEVPKAVFYRVDSIAKIDDLDRGGGFGSTGLK